MLLNLPTGAYLPAGGSERPWDFGRFIRTISYFNEAPSPGKILSAIISQPQRAFSALTGSSVEV